MTRKDRGKVISGRARRRKREFSQKRVWTAPLLTRPLTPSWQGPGSTGLRGSWLWSRTGEVTLGMGLSASAGLTLSPA